MGNAKYPAEDFNERYCVGAPYCRMVIRWLCNEYEVFILYMYINCILFWSILKYDLLWVCKCISFEYMLQPYSRFMFKPIIVYLIHFVYHFHFKEIELFLMLNEKTNAVLTRVYNISNASTMDSKHGFLVSAKRVLLVIHKCVQSFSSLEPKRKLFFKCEAGVLILVYNLFSPSLGSLILYA